MDVEPQYPVDTATQHGIDAAAGAGDVPTDAANLAEYMNEGLNQKESGGAGKNRSSAGRGSGPNGERLKVRAVIVKRTTNGSRPEGGRGGRGGGRAGSAPTKREKVTKREDGFVCVNIHGKDVLVVAPTGEVQLNGGGDTGHDTFRAMNDSLNRFGFKLTKSQTDETQWTLGDGKRVLQRYEHGMIIPAPTPPGPGRGLALMQRDEPKPENGHFSGGFARGWSPGGRGFGRGRGRGRY